MRHRTLAATASVLILIGLLLSGFGPVLARQAGQQGSDLAPESEFKAGEVLVKFRGDLVSGAVAEAVRVQAGAVSVRTLSKSDVELWQVPEGREQAIADELNDNPAVEYAELNYRYYVFDVPNDPDYASQWAHEIMNSPAAWDLTTGSATVTVAILDSGIDENHPDLKSKIVAGYDFVDNDADPHDLNGHGTHCAGIAAAVTDNALGIAGLDWQARIMPVRFIAADGGGYTSDLVLAIEWAYQHGADVISLSLGGPDYSQTLQDMINEAHVAGTLIVAAMGNYRLSGNPTMYPAANDNVMAVAATNRSDSYAYYSQYGNHCDIAAPGGAMSYIPGDPNGILSTLPTYSSFYLRTEYGVDIGYDYLQGTSMAAPYVAGLAALIWSMDPSLTPDQVQNTIQNTAEDLGPTGWDVNYGWGRIDAYAAVQTLIPPAPTLNAISNPDGDGSYVVDWTDVPAATAYTLEEDDNLSFSSPTVRYTGSGSQYSISSQSPGTWYYRARAIRVLAAGPWSNQQATTVMPNPPILNAIVNPSELDEYQISWSAAVGATSYTLEEDDNPSFTSPQTRYEGASLSYNVTGQPGDTWYYRARASNPAGDSGWSNVASTIVAPSSLTAPDLLPINNADQDGSYLVDWDYTGSVTSTATFVLEESGNPYFDAPTTVYEGGPSQFNVTSQAAGTWYYRVRAVESPTVKSPWSLTQPATVPSWAYLPIVAHNLLTAGGTGVANGKFEDGEIGWTEWSSEGWPLILSTELPVPAHSGTWAVWLGGGVNETSYIEQQVTILASTPYLHYWYWSESTDSCGNDLATIRLNGAAVKTQDLCALESTGGWVEAVVDLAAFAGQSVSLQFHVVNDAERASSLFVDDVSLQDSSAAARTTASGAITVDTVPTKLEIGLQP